MTEQEKQNIRTLVEWMIDHCLSEDDFWEQWRAHAAPPEKRIAAPKNPAKYYKDVQMVRAVILLMEVSRCTENRAINDISRQYKKSPAQVRYALKYYKDPVRKELASEKRREMAKQLMGEPLGLFGPVPSM
jgi:hypothetical protein